MTEINLARNDIGDDGMASAAYYVSKDQAMRSLLLQANRVTVSTGALLLWGRRGQAKAGEKQVLFCGAPVRASLRAPLPVTRLLG